MTQSQHTPGEPMHDALTYLTWQVEPCRCSYTDRLEAIETHGSAQRYCTFELRSRMLITALFVSDNNARGSTVAQAKLPLGRLPSDTCFQPSSRCSYKRSSQRPSCLGPHHPQGRPRWSTCSWFQTHTDTAIVAICLTIGLSKHIFNVSESHEEPINRIEHWITVC